MLLRRPLPSIGLDWTALSESGAFQSTCGERPLLPGEWVPIAATHCFEPPQPIAKFYSAHCPFQMVSCPSRAARESCGCARVCMARSHAPQPSVDPWECFERLSMFSAQQTAFLGPELITEVGKRTRWKTSRFCVLVLGHVLEVRPKLSVLSPLNRGVDSVKISRADAPPLR